MADLSPVIGRERELAALDEMLGSAHLVTVTGAGGCGKTRVAVELAHRARDRTEPLEGFVVELAAERTSDQVLGALLRTVGARERGGHARAEVLLHELADRGVLLVLDNCEHLLAEVASVALALLHHAPQVRLLATSREPLGVDGEILFPLAPLSVPHADGDVAAVVRSDAGRFFVDRAVAADPSFALTPATAKVVSRICRDLDGLPLALRLAAASVAGPTSLSEVAEGLSQHGRLSAGPGGELPQHRSVRASLDWSYELLDETQRALLGRLAAFAGGFTVAAAGAVALPRASETDVRTLLEALERKGLINRVATKGPPRWELLRTVADYATERLALDDEAPYVHKRHLEWFTAYAGAADDLLLEPDGRELVDEEWPNLRRALEQALERDPLSALRMAAGLTYHWILAERFDDALTFVTAALSANPADADATARAAVHCGAGVIATLTEDYAAALAHLRAGLALMPDDDSEETGARCRQLSSMVLILTGVDPVGGLASAHLALERLRSRGDRLALAFALATVAFAEGLCDRFAGVRSACDELRAIPGVTGHVRLETWAELAAAWAEVVVGSPARALLHADRAIAFEGGWPSMTHFVAVSHRLHSLAHLGRTAEAVDEGMEALALAERSGAAMAVPAIEMALAVAELADGRLGAADARARRVVELPQLHTAALMREVLARVALARGDAHEAAVQGLELEALAERTGSRRQHAVADLVAGSAATLTGDDDRARDLIHASLAVHEELGLERGAADALDGLATIAAGDGDVARAARLAGAAAATRTRVGCVPPKPSAERIDAIRAQFAARGSGPSWQAAWIEGAALALADAIAYARRSRGRRDRPTSGWRSLTPTERRVAELAATGISNPQIATTLFMSRGTVKMHLSNVYAKLHVANRTELAHASVLRSADDGRSSASTAAACAE